MDITFAKNSYPKHTNIMENYQDANLRAEINARFGQAVDFLLKNKLARNKNEIMNRLGLYLGRLSLLLGNKANVSTDNLAMMSKVYGISTEWLLLGTGNMIGTTIQKAAEAKRQKDMMMEALPLIPMNAIGRVNGQNDSLQTNADCPKYLVPEFINAGAQFMTRIQGNSMSPTLQSGDVVACKKVEADSWIEYGDAYIIDGQQGMMIKRVYNEASDSKKLLCRSDNPEVAPITIDRDDIISMSRILGVVRNL